MKGALIVLLMVALLTATTGAATFTGVISDDMCAKGDHSRMRMGSDDAECANACVSAHGASYVLYDGTNIYTLNDDKTPEKFAGKKVRVVGTLDSKTRTIRVESIALAQ